MRSTLTILAALSLTTGCSTLDPLEESPFGDSEEIGCDTGTEDSGSEIDSGITEDTAEVLSCEFEVETTEGTTVMANTITISQAQGAASGSQEPSEELRAVSLQFDNDDLECSPLIVDSLRFLVVWTDKADSGWQPQNIWGMDRLGNTYEGEIQDMGGLIFVDFELGYQIEAGDYGLFAVNIDTTGADTDLDDQVRVDLYPNSLTVDDGTVSATLVHESVNGGTIVF